MIEKTRPTGEVIEILPQIENLLYSPPQLREFGFPTRGATRSEVTYDSQGNISRIQLRKAGGAVTADICLVVDKKGYILEMIHYAGEFPLDLANFSRWVALSHERSIEGMSPAGYWREPRT